MMRLLLWMALFYLAYRFLKGFGKKPDSQSTVGGNPASKPLDLDRKDVQDARFVDLDDSKKKT
jgi:hypothetical protein